MPVLQCTGELSACCLSPEIIKSEIRDGYFYPLKRQQCNRKHCAFDLKNQMIEKILYQGRDVNFI